MKKLLITLVSLVSIGSLVEAMQPTVVKPPALRDFNHGGGFVAPVTTYANEVYLLLGKEAAGRDKGTYDAFGGALDVTEDAFDDHPRQTSSREFYEEAITSSTFGMDKHQAKKYIDLPAGNTTHIFAVTDPQGNRNVLYLTGFSNRAITNFKNKFGSARRAVRGRKFREKDAIASIKMADILAAIAASPRNTGVTVRAQVTDLQGKRTMQTITLRPVLVKMLRGYAERRAFVAGKDRRIRFYRL